VARSLHAPEDEWHTLGFFHARNARGYQVFKLSSAPQSYFRFLRIDFLEHYGTEFYCPVSLLRVYGRNEREDADDDMMDDINALDDDDVSDMLDDTVPSEPLLELASTHAIDGNRVVERACER
ncbi:SUN domain-containing protein, partial [Klebsiella pneumoniae]|nr:SUN domain-containing protein [Klebsiella pneumoniae]